MVEGEGTYSPMDTKVEDAAAAQYKTMCLIVRQGRGSCVIDAYNDVLHAQACLLGDAALGDLPESVRKRAEERARECVIDKVRYTACGHKLCGINCLASRAKCI